MYGKNSFFMKNVCSIDYNEGNRKKIRSGLKKTVRLSCSQKKFGQKEKQWLAASKVYLSLINLSLNILITSNINGYLSNSKKIHWGKCKIYIYIILIMLKKSKYSK